MRVREMHPLCCISIESPADQTPRTGFLSSSMRGSDTNVNVAGVLYKWTNYGKGWRSRWFSLHNGVLSYSRVGRLEGVSTSDEVRVIGDASARLIGGSSSCRRKQQGAIGVVHLKVTLMQDLYLFTLHE